jgi:hypothetical protein
VREKIETEVKLKIYIFEKKELNKGEIHPPKHYYVEGENRTMVLSQSHCLGYVVGLHKYNCMDTTSPTKVV